MEHECAFSLLVVVAEVGVVDRNLWALPPFICCHSFKVLDGQAGWGKLAEWATAAASLTDASANTVCQCQCWHLVSGTG